MTDASNTTTATLCRNCRKRPAEQQIAYREQSVHFGPRRFRSRVIRTISRTGSVSLCSRCAALYERSAALRERGQQVAERAFWGMLLGGALFVLVAALFSPRMDGVFALIGGIIGLLLVIAFVAGILLLAAGILLRGPATRFLRQ